MLTSPSALRPRSRTMLYVCLGGVLRSGTWCVFAAFSPLRKCEVAMSVREPYPSARLSLRAHRFAGIMVLTFAILNAGARSTSLETRRERERARCVSMCALRVVVVGIHAITRRRLGLATTSCHCSARYGTSYG